MPFEAHYKAQRQLHDAAAAELEARVPVPTPEQLLTASGRARWYRKVREVGVKVLGELMTEADRLGKEHAAEVVAEFKERTA